MGAYTCQYGVVHKVCRCTTPHTIECDKPEEHGYKPKHRAEPIYTKPDAPVSRHRRKAPDA